MDEPGAKRRKKDESGCFDALQSDQQEYAKAVLDWEDDDWILDEEGRYVENIDSKGVKRKKKDNNQELQNIVSKLVTTKNKITEHGPSDEDIYEIMSNIENLNKCVASGSSVQTPDIRSKTVGDNMKNSITNKSPIASIVKVPEESCDKSALKEIVDNDLNNDLDKKKEDSIKKSDNFIVDQPTIKPQHEQITKAENVTQEEIDFMLDDDFDFSSISINDIVPPDEEIIGGFDFEFNVDMEDFDFSGLNLGSEGIPKDVFDFYWWDAYEDQINRPGVVVLFGKTYCEESKKFVSCSVIVGNVLRRIYLLPYVYNRLTGAAVSMNDVYTEFNEKIANRLKTFKCKKVEKFYAFDSSVPVKSEYLEVRFEGDMDLSERTFDTIWRVFGMGSSFLEIFLLERKIKGPCWLNVSNYEKSSNPSTHVEVEIKCTRSIDVAVQQSQSVKPMDPPPLKVLALNIKTTVGAKTGINEIAMISFLVNKNYCLNKKMPNPPFQEYYCILTKLPDKTLPSDLHWLLKKFKATRVQNVNSEKALLDCFLTQYVDIDPDLIVGHDLSGYQFTILTDRLINNRSTDYSRLSRIRRNYDKYTKYNIEKALFSGRLVCDVKASAKELIRLRSYDLDSLCLEVLKLPDGQRIEIEPEIMKQMYRDSKELFKSISMTLQDTVHILRVMFELNVIPLALQITNIAGYIMSRTLMGGRSERIEFLLLHAFDEHDYIVPEKVGKTYQKKDGKKPTYSGGLVLEPKVGLYDKLVLLMDFNSLYPSIIREYNICFSTVTDPTACDQEGSVLPDEKVPAGILPIEIGKLVDSRKEVKQLMKNLDLSPDLYAQYNIRQTAIKLMANSMYGCLGFSNSRFYAKGLAALITQKGREILSNTKEAVQKMKFDVIYGDTDSLMINTNMLDYANVLEVGTAIKREINKLYRQVELDIDGVFKYLLLLNKKKYAAVALNKGKNGELIETQEHKGIDIVRRDWSQISAEAGRYVLNHILCNQSSDERIKNIHRYLQKLKNDFDKNAVPNHLLVISKQLNKAPNLYAEKNSLPHVQVALRLNKTKGKKFKAGDTVPYIICNNGTNDLAVHRAYHPDELKHFNNLTVDREYYLASQIHPVISRLCEPIVGTDELLIAECLGIEIAEKAQSSPTKYATPTDSYIKEMIDPMKNAEPFVFKCVACGSENTVEEPGKNDKLALDACVNEKCLVRPVDYVKQIKNQLTNRMRNYIANYYKSTSYYEDPVCKRTTGRLPQCFSGKFPLCGFCGECIPYRETASADLNSQLCFLKTIFDVEKFNKGNVEPILLSANNLLKESVEQVLKSSGYATLDFTSIFQHAVDHYKRP